MKKLMAALIITVVVFAGSLWLLQVNYDDIPVNVRVYIALGGGLFSGVISYFMIGMDQKDKNQTLGK